MNRLKNEKSQYLLQHKDNPIDWWAWGPDALQAAKDQKKPLFISIGYSTCHWCHVMAGESFSSEAIAQKLNQDFICIKVDREEHPDIDHYYQHASQMMTGRGGWPLSVFATEDSEPFFIGTYFPEQAKNGLPGFGEIIGHIKDRVDSDLEGLTKQARELTAALKENPKVEKKVEYHGHFPHPQAVMQALEPYMDKENGGYGSAPKFPQLAFYEWAIEQMLEGMLSQEQGQHIIDSLERMLMGGIYDHAKGGLHRYSTDEKFLVPHFEKMLYDQAGFLRIYSKASLLYPSPLFFDAQIQVLDYLKSEMRSEKGYFFAAQDADSEGVEGLYFTYSKDEFDAAMINHDPELDNDLGKIHKWFSISKEGNFENNLNVISLNPEYKNEFYEPQNWELVRKVKLAILEDRKDRIPPATDSKGISSWNFQLLTALCDVIQYNKIEPIRNRAVELLFSTIEGLQGEFIKQPEGEDRYVICHTNTRDGHYPFFEDYVFFAESQLRAYELTGNTTLLENLAQTISFIMNEFYRDGHFYTRSIQFEDSEPYPNIHAPMYDQSFRSPLGTFISLVRKASTVMDLEEISSKLDTIKELMTQMTLQNPLACGESLRALTYPDGAYKKVEIPRAWLEREEFTKFLPHFSSRFFLNFHTSENEKWQVCNINECELTGEGIEEFEKAFAPQEVEMEDNGESNE